MLPKRFTRFGSSTSTSPHLIGLISLFIFSVTYFHTVQGQDPVIKTISNWQKFSGWPKLNGSLSTDFFFVAPNATHNQFEWQLTSINNLLSPNQLFVKRGNEGKLTVSFKYWAYPIGDSKPKFVFSFYGLDEKKNTTKNNTLNLHNNYKEEWTEVTNYVFDYNLKMKVVFNSDDKDSVVAIKDLKYVYQTQENKTDDAPKKLALLSDDKKSKPDIKYKPNEWEVSRVPLVEDGYFYTNKEFSITSNFTKAFSKVLITLCVLTTDPKENLTVTIENDLNPTQIISNKPWQNVTFEINKTITENNTKDYTIRFLLNNLNVSQNNPYWYIKDIIVDDVDHCRNFSECKFWEFEKGINVKWQKLDKLYNDMIYRSLKKDEMFTIDTHEADITDNDVEFKLTYWTQKGVDSIKLFGKNSNNQSVVLFDFTPKIIESVTTETIAFKLSDFTIKNLDEISIAVDGGSDFDKSDFIMLVNYTLLPAYFIKEVPEFIYNWNNNFKIESQWHSMTNQINVDSKEGLVNYNEIVNKLEQEDGTREYFVSDWIRVTNQLKSGNNQLLKFEKVKALIINVLYYDQDYELKTIDKLDNITGDYLKFVYQFKYKKPDGKDEQPAATIKNIHFAAPCQGQDLAKKCDSCSENGLINYYTCKCNDNQYWDKEKKECKTYIPVTDYDTSGWSKIVTFGDKPDSCDRVFYIDKAQCTADCVITQKQFNSKLKGIKTPFYLWTGYTSTASNKRGAINITIVNKTETIANQWKKISFDDEIEKTFSINLRNDAGVYYAICDRNDIINDKSSIFISSDKQEQLNRQKLIWYPAANKPLTLPVSNSIKTHSYKLTFNVSKATEIILKTKDQMLQTNTILKEFFIEPSKPVIIDLQKLLANSNLNFDLLFDFKKDPKFPNNFEIISIENKENILKFKPKEQSFLTDWTKTDSKTFASEWSDERTVNNDGNITINEDKKKIAFINGTQIKFISKKSVLVQSNWISNQPVINKESTVELTTNKDIELSICNEFMKCWLLTIVQKNKKWKIPETFTKENKYFKFVFKFDFDEGNKNADFTIESFSFDDKCVGYQKCEKENATCSTVVEKSAKLPNCYCKDNYQYYDEKCQEIKPYDASRWHLYKPLPQKIDFNSFVYIYEPRSEVEINWGKQFEKISSTVNFPIKLTITYYLSKKQDNFEPKVTVSKNNNIITNQTKKLESNEKKEAEINLNVKKSDKIKLDFQKSSGKSEDIVLFIGDIKITSDSSADPVFSCSFKENCILSLSNAIWSRKLDINNNENFYLSKTSGRGPMTYKFNIKSFNMDLKLEYFSLDFSNKAITTPKINIKVLNNEETTEETNGLEFIPETRKMSVEQTLKRIETKLDLLQDLKPNVEQRFRIMINLTSEKIIDNDLTFLLQVKPTFKKNEISLPTTTYLTRWDQVETKPGWDQWAQTIQKNDYINKDTFEQTNENNNKVPFNNYELQIGGKSPGENSSSSIVFHSKWLLSPKKKLVKSPSVVVTISQPDGLSSITAMICNEKMKCEKHLNKVDKKDQRIIFSFKNEFDQINFYKLMFRLDFASASDKKDFEIKISSLNIGDPCFGYDNCKNKALCVPMAFDLRTCRCTQDWDGNNCQNINYCTTQDKTKWNKTSNANGETFCKGLFDRSLGCINVPSRQQFYCACRKPDYFWNADRQTCDENRKNDGEDNCKDKSCFSRMFTKPTNRFYWVPKSFNPINPTLDNPIYFPLDNPMLTVNLQGDFNKKLNSYCLMMKYFVSKKSSLTLLFSKDESSVILKSSGNGWTQQKYAFCLKNLFFNPSNNFNLSFKFDNKDNGSTAIQFGNEIKNDDREMESISYLTKWNVRDDLFKYVPKFESMWPTRIPLENENIDKPNFGITTKNNLIVVEANEKYEQVYLFSNWMMGTGKEMKLRFNLKQNGSNFKPDPVICDGLTRCKKLKKKNGVYNVNPEAKKPFKIGFEIEYQNDKLKPKGKEQLNIGPIVMGDVCVDDKNLDQNACTNNGKCNRIVDDKTKEEKPSCHCNDEWRGIRCHLVDYCHKPHEVNKTKIIQKGDDFCKQFAATCDKTPAIRYNFTCKCNNPDLFWNWNLETPKCDKITPCMFVNCNENEECAEKDNNGKELKPPQCKCLDNYEKVDGKCQWFDACQKNKTLCGPNVFCMKTGPKESDVKCGCPSKFEVQTSNDDHPKIKNVKLVKCLPKFCALPKLFDCQHICVNNDTTGSYTCQCGKKYKLIANNKCELKNPKEPCKCDKIDKAYCDEQSNGDCLCRDGYVYERNPNETLPGKCVITIVADKLGEAKSLCPNGNVSITSGSCNCPSGFTETSNGLCQVFNPCASKKKGQTACEKRNAMCLPQSDGEYKCKCPVGMVPFNRSDLESSACKMACQVDENDVWCNEKNGKCDPIKAFEKLNNKNYDLKNKKFEDLCKCKPGMVWNKKNESCFFATYSTEFDITLKRKEMFDSLLISNGTEIGGDSTGKQEKYDFEGYKQSMKETNDFNKKMAEKNKDYRLANFNNLIGERIFSFFQAFYQDIHKENSTISCQEPQNNKYQCKLTLVFTRSLEKYKNQDNFDDFKGNCKENKYIGEKDYCVELGLNLEINNSSLDFTKMTTTKDNCQGNICEELSFQFTECKRIPGTSRFDCDCHKNFKQILNSKPTLIGDGELVGRAYQCEEMNHCTDVQTNPCGSLINCKSLRVGTSTDTNVPKYFCNCPNTNQYWDKKCLDVCTKDSCNKRGQCTAKVTQMFNETSQRGKQMCNCNDGFFGEECQSEHNNAQVGLIVGVCIAGVAALVLMVTTFIFYNKSKKSNRLSGYQIPLNERAPEVGTSDPTNFVYRPQQQQRRGHNNPAYNDP